MRKSDLITSIAMIPDTDERLHRIGLILTGKDPSSIKAPERLIKRVEVARRLGLCPRSVDNLSADGALKPVRLPGRMRAVGFRESDVRALLDAGPSPSRGGES